MIEATKNAERFKGFAETYDSARPSVPFYPVKIIKRYLGKQPDKVIDMGCGTGLSTIIWKDNCSNVFGIEPSDDMRKVAKTRESDKISFIKAFSHNTSIEDNFADVVVCSQSFHWMEPKSTLKEIDRILKKGGIFATIDCDWPPVSDWKVEKTYTDIFAKVKRIENDYPELKNKFISYDKTNHLTNIKSSGYFSYCREILFSNTEKATGERLINLFLSQGGLQSILNTKPELITKDIEFFRKEVFNTFEDSEFEIEFCYRMRIGVK